MQGGERYNSISNYLKDYFGVKTVKLSIDAGFTCPNRDGLVGYGGCAFCSSEGSGDFASNFNETGKITETINEQIELLSDKWPDAAYLAYFQSHTNTYAPVDVLRSKYYEALDDQRIRGIVIATRPDCLDDNVLDLLEEINQKYFMWIELGLQTIHEETRDLMNIGYSLEQYDKAVEALHARNIKVVTHLILGLPHMKDSDNSYLRETDEQILNSLAYVCHKPIFGLKLHLLNVIRNSRMYNMMPEYVSFDDMEEYVNLVVRCLELVPPEITIHRLTADAPRSELVSPEWSYKKRTILNMINKELKEKDTYQGAKLK